MKRMAVYKNEVDADRRRFLRSGLSAVVMLGLGGAYFGLNSRDDTIPQEIKIDENSINNEEVEIKTIQQAFYNDDLVNPEAAPFIHHYATMFGKYPFEAAAIILSEGVRTDRDRYKKNYLDNGNIHREVGIGQFNEITGQNGFNVADETYEWAKKVYGKLVILDPVLTRYSDIEDLVYGDELSAALLALRLDLLYRNFYQPNKENLQDNEGEFLARAFHKGGVGALRMEGQYYVDRFNHYLDVLEKLKEEFIEDFSNTASN